MDLGIAGKAALITGSSRGTGAVVAEVLAREGATVFVHGNTEAAQGEIAAAITDAGGAAHAITGDLATDSGADAVAESVGEVAGRVDILVNNFGQAAGGKWGDVSTDDWVDIYQRNTLSAVRMIDRLVPGMREHRWGRVIQIATIGVWRPNARMPHYYASKGALANLTVSLARELAGTGITANTVSPGLIKTDELEQYFRYRATKKGWGEDWATIEAEGVREMMPNPVGRMARKEEVADAVAFLASDRAGYLNGVNLRVDGGATELVF